MPYIRGSWKRDIERVEGSCSTSRVAESMKAYGKKINGTDEAMSIFRMVMFTKVTTSMVKLMVRVCSPGPMEKCMMVSG